MFKLKIFKMKISELELGLGLGLGFLDLCRAMPKF